MGMKRTARLVALLALCVTECSGFVVPRCALRQRRTNSYRTRSSWHHNSFRTTCASKGNILSCESSLDDSEGDNTKSRMTPRQVLLQGWADFKFGASHVHTNYLKLLSYIYLRVFVVASIFVFALATAYSISPSVGEWAVRSTLQALYALSRAEIVLLLPFIVFLAIVLRALLLLPTRLAYLIMMIPNQATKGVALAAYVDQLKLQLHLMLRAAAEKTSKNATLLPIVAFLRQKTSLGIILFIVVVAPIMEELKFRYLYDYMRGKLAHILHFSDRDGFALKVSTAIGSFIFACAHISNWVPVSSSMNATTVMDTNVNAAILVSFSATAQFVSSFFISQRLLFPVYQERGLAASIGAHATWNAFTLTSNFQVPIRLVVRTWNRLGRGNRAS